MRLEKLKDLLKKKKIDLALIFSIGEETDKNLIYFTGYSGLGVLAVQTNAPTFLLVPDMEYEKAKKTAIGIKVFRTDKKKRLLESLSLLLKKEEIKKIGIDETTCPVYLYKKLKKSFKAAFVDADYLFCSMRSIKEDSELRNIRKACSITDDVFTKICNNFRFKKEKEIKEFIEEEIAKAGGELSFPPIVASREGSSQPHYNANNMIKNGFLMLDFGAKYNGYCADMTRMLYIGTPKKSEIEDYKLVLKTVLGCEKAATQKEKFSELYELSLSLLGKKSGFFTHGLGHGLGLEIHEHPSLTFDEKEKIGEDIAFTVEPGIYFPGKYGIRIEDTVVIKNKRLEVLTKSEKNLVIIKNS